MSHKHVYEATDLEYGSDSFRSVERVGSEKRQRPTMGRQRGKAHNRSMACIAAAAERSLGKHSPLCLFALCER